MNTARPLLFLDSPNVGMIGHAYVISRDNRSAPGEAELREVAHQARSGAPQKEFITVKRSVVQHDTQRDAEELLVCTGAVPAKAEDGDTVRKVLAELLKQKISPDALKSGYLSKQSGLIYSAPCMDEIVSEFHADPRIQSVCWRNSTAQATQPPPLPPPPPTKWRMKLLALFLLLAAVPILRRPETSLQKAKESPRSTALPDDAQEAQAWAFLTTDEWPRLMEATGGQGALKALQALQKNLKNNPNSGLMEGVEKRLQKAFQTEADKQTEPPPTDLKPALQLVNGWADLFFEEFPDDGAKLSESKPIRLKDSSCARILQDAKANSSGRSISNVSGWITDYQNQQKNYPEKIKQHAQELEDFLSAFSEKSGEEIPAKLRTLWSELNNFADSKAVATESEPFRLLVKSQLDKLSAPPQGYSTATLRDAKRIVVLKEILGGKDIGLALLGEPYGVAQTDWKKIRSRVQMLGKVAHGPSANAAFKASLIHLFE